MNFRLKTVLGVAAIEAMLLTILVLSVLGIMRAGAQEQLLERAHGAGNLLAAASRDALLGWDFSALETLAREAGESANLHYVRFLDVDGWEMARWGELPSPFAADAALENVKDGVFDSSVPVMVAGRPYGQVQFGIDIAGVNDSLGNLRRWALGISALEMVMVALFSAMLGLYLTRHLQSIRDAAAKFAAGDLSHRIDVRGSDELAETAAAFNRMADRLQAVHGEIAGREARFREFSEAVSDWFWETDKDERYTYVSDTFEQVTGRTPDTLLGKRRWDLGSAKMEVDAEMWLGHMEDLAAHRSFRDFKYWMEDDQGRPLWVKESGIPRFDEMGQFLGYRGAGSDITAAVENAHRMHMLTRAVEQSPVSVVITDLDRMIQYVNPKFLETTGYEISEVLGATPNLLRSGETPAETYAELWATLERGEQWRGEFINRRKDGSLYWEQASIQPIRNVEGRITNYLGIKLDISEGKRAERRMALLLDELKRSNKDLEQFAYVASHDLKQPLRQISSYATLIQRTLPADALGESAHYLGFLVDGAKRMQALVNDLLAYSRVSHKPVESAPVSMDEALDAALALLTAPVQESAAIINRKPLPQVRGDRSQLERLMQNLVGNALKYRDPDRVPVIDVYCDADGVFCVADNGIGIPPDQADRVFLIFQRLHAAQAYEGTGIGLAICRKIVERHGGRIWLHSEGEGKGCAFHFTLPGASEPDEAEKML